MSSRFNKSELSYLFCNLREIIEANPKIRFWWRDDDVAYINIFRPDMRIIAYRRLRDMLALLAKFNIPYFFAVVPYKFLINFNPLLNLLKEYQALVAIHGIAHKNRAETGIKSEFPPGESSDYHIDKVLLYYQQLKKEFKSNLLPFFVPPFNYMSPDATILLEEKGLIISASNALSHTSVKINVDYDMVNWSQRKIYPYETIINDLIEIIKDNHKTIGINGHHKIFNKQDLYFFQSLFEIINPSANNGKEFFLDIANKNKI